jgi:GAF domain-containing protein
VSREHLLLRTLVELADTLVADYDAIDFLSTLCERAAEAVGATAVGVLVVHEGDDLDVVAASSQDMRALEVFEVRNGEGPCMDAYRTGAPVTAIDLDDDERWPTFRARATGLGYRSVLGQPLRLRDVTIGALNAYRGDPGPFSDADVEVLRGLADMATIGIMHERTMRSADEQISDLRRSLTDRAVVEQAKGLIAERLSITPDDGFDRLRRHARSRNQRVRAAAQRILRGDLDPTEL